MISIDIPGFGRLAIDHLVLDYNGTLALDGVLVPGVGDLLNSLARELTVHVVTADTFGKAAAGLSGTDCRLTILDSGHQDQAKVEFVSQLGAEQTASIGNGRNDALMLEKSALGIAVILGEGASAESVNAADIVCTDICAALELLMHPLRLTATLRS
jgi:soluble P-type ATPase